MKKKVISALLSTAMVASLLVGCGSSSADTAAPADDAAAETTEEAPAEDAAPADDAAAETTEEAPAGDEGQVLNIYCWNEEFKSRVTAHYADYEEVDATTGKIGDVTVKWNITPNADNAYQNNLDAALLNQESAAADDKIDIFLVDLSFRKM